MKNSLSAPSSITFLGTFGEGISLLGWAVIVLSGALILWWLYPLYPQQFSPDRFYRPFSHRQLSRFGIAVLFAATLFSGHNFGSLGMTLIYVLGRLHPAVFNWPGAGVFYVPSRSKAGPSFRVTFFLPLMITPVGIAYQWRMLADMRMGPVTPLWQWLGLEEFAWGSDPWAARTMVMIGDAWMWIPFIFVVMLAALESVSRDLT